MNFVDVAGPPGVGKSTLCDVLWGHRAVGWDGKLPPQDWQPFLDEVTRLFLLIRTHWSFGPAIRMNNRSLRKMATVARMEGDGPYIQTGLIQRGLGFGWRLNEMGADVNEIRRYFELMPVSIGAVFLTAPTEVIQERNRKRLLNPETAHENRAFMVPLMERPIEVAEDVLGERGVPVLTLDTTRPLDEVRQELIDFANRPPFAPVGDAHTTIAHAPEWWQ